MTVHYLYITFATIKEPLFGTFSCWEESVTVLTSQLHVLNRIFNALQSLNMYKVCKDPCDNTWLHIRAFKNNMSELGTYFECERVRCTFFDFAS